MSTSSKRGRPGAPLPAEASSEASQNRLADDLFDAIMRWDVDEVVCLASQMDCLDSHRRPSHGDTPLLFAARCDLPVAGVSFLLSRSDPLLTAWDGASALLLAAMGDSPHSPSLVSLLLPVSDPLALADGTESALLCSLRDCHLEIMAILLPHSDLAQRDHNGNTPLEKARKSRCAEGDEAADLILGEMARRESEAIARCAGSSISTNSSAPRL